MLGEALCSEILTRQTPKSVTHRAQEACWTQTGERNPSSASSTQAKPPVRSSLQSRKEQITGELNKKKEVELHGTVDVCCVCRWMLIPARLSMSFQLTIVVDNTCCYFTSTQVLSDLRCGVTTLQTKTIVTRIITAWHIADPLLRPKVLSFTKTIL